MDTQPVAAAPAAPSAPQTPSPSPEPVAPPEDPRFAAMAQQTAKLQSAVDSILAFIAAQGAAPSTAPAAPTVPTSDDQLWEAAQRGDRPAIEEIQRRAARQVFAEQAAAASAMSMVDNQLRILAAKYPVLNDAAHPLSQTAKAAYQTLVGLGYAQTRATLLEAIKTAIADRPDLIVELNTGQPFVPAAPAPSPRTPHPGMTAPQPRRAPTSPAVSGAPKVLPGEETIAQRMGITDVAGAKKRFLERHAAGQSALGAVANFVNLDDF